jgi:hypothetical protein
MTTLHSIARALTGILASATLVASHATAARADQADAAGETIVAAADCYSVGEQVASQHGGTLAKASASSQGGRTVCVIVVLVPGKDGQRPRRMQVVVPAG